jgi:hypothetical protein
MPIGDGNTVESSDAKTAMGEVLTWGAVITAAASILAWINFWMSAGADRQRITNVEALATATMAKAEILSSNLAEFKIEAARDFASSSDLAGAERRFASAVDSLGVRFDRMAERLDRVLDSIRPHP